MLPLALLLGGCSSKPIPSDSGVEPGRATFVRALCSYYQRCESAIGRVFENAEACTDHWSQAVTCDANISLASDDALRACAARLEDIVDCNYDTDDPTSACAGVFLGPKMARVGEPCLDGICNFDAFCRYGQTLTSCPMCVKYAAVGEACVTQPGAPDYRPCDPARAYCNDGVCAPKKDLGFACTSAEQCGWAVCRDSKCALPLPPGSACAAGEVCAGRFRICRDGTCVDRQAPGGACGRDQHCLPSDECDQGACKRFSACGGRKSGELCSVPGQCADGLYCGPSGGGLRCLPVVAPGGSCVNSAEACGPNGFCVIQSTQCAARVPLDGSCPGTGCVWGAYCSGLENVCRVLKAPGAPCEVYWECASQRCDGEPKKCVDTRVCSLPDGGSFVSRDAG